MRSGSHDDMCLGNRTGSRPSCGVRTHPSARSWSVDYSSTVRVRSLCNHQLPNLFMKKAHLPTKDNLRRSRMVPHRLSAIRDVDRKAEQTAHGTTHNLDRFQTAP